MTSRLVAVSVVEGQLVSPGDVVAVVEAMKMEYPLVCHIRGRVKKIYFGQSAQVGRGDLIFSLQRLGASDADAPEQSL